MLKPYLFKYEFYDDKDLELNLEWIDDINYPFLSPLETLFNSGRPIGKLAFLTLYFENQHYAFGTIKPLEDLFV